MPSITDTAYPRLKAHPTAKDLNEIYTPHLFEVVFAEERTRQPAPRVGLWLLLKTFQRLGYFVPYAEIPLPVVSHLARCAGYPGVPEGMVASDASTARDRHMALVRAFIGVTAYGHAARQIIVEASLEAARTRDDLADIINVAIEELVRQRYELPAFGTLLKIARAARARVNRDYQTQVGDRLDATVRARLFTLLTRAAGAPHRLWDRVKREPKQPTVRHLEECLAPVQWLRDQHVTAGVFADIPDVKVKQFAAEARSLDVTSMNDLPERKRLTLAAAFGLTQMTRALDDVAEMCIRQVQRMHHKAQEALLRHQAEHADRTEALMGLLRDVTLAYKTEGTREQRFAAIADLLGPDTAGILARCEAHRAVAGHNYLPLLPTFYRGRRGTLFRFLEGVPLTSTSQDQALPQAIALLLTHKASRQEWLPIICLTRDHERSAPPASLVDLSFVSEKWWPLVTGTTDRDVVITQVDRRAVELCVFSQILLELKSGDLCIHGSDRFSDYREPLVSPEEYAHEVTRYGEQAGIPIEGHTFTAQLRAQLEAAAQRANDGFPTNTYVRLEHGEPVLTRLRRQPDPAGLRRLEQLLKERMSPVEILDALSDTEHWLHWTQHFGPVSGYEAKFEQPRERYLMTTFCYGCNLGPTQTARSIKGLDRKQVAFVNQRHVTEENLHEAIVTVINAYHRFPLQELWGTGTSASADGTKGDLYPQNLMAEYHIRYGGYGGLGYYLLADTYIALFSRFTTCGSWEGHYILDFVTENQSEVRPDTVHADTQGQSAAIFGLAYLLGIQLMPRIRHWKDLHLYRPGPDSRYAHIDGLFTAQVDWELIETLLPDMLRVALSVKAGRITPSAIRRRLATYSRKNKLYFAFRALGRVVRTIFLLRYLSEIDLRRKIQAATNKSEAFNKFAQWVSFGGSGVIAENVRDEQRKVIKYNHLVANLLIFHTLVTMTRGVQQMWEDGYDIDLEALATLRPYQTEHINRFGMYTLNPNRIPAPLESYLRLLPASEGGEIPHMQHSVSF